MICPSEVDWIDVKWILKCLWESSNFSLLYGVGNSKGVLEAFSDSDFAGDVRRRQSNWGMMAVYADSATAWSSQLKRSVALSTKAEFIAVSEGAKICFGGNVCLENFSEKIVRYQRYMLTMQVQWNSRKLQFHKQSKQDEVRYYFLRECYQEGRTGVEHIDRGKQLANLLTKSLDRVRFQNLCN